MEKVRLELEREVEETETRAVLAEQRLQQSEAEFQKVLLRQKGAFEMDLDRLSKERVGLIVSTVFPRYQINVAVATGARGAGPPGTHILVGSGLLSQVLEITNNYIVRGELKGVLQRNFP